MKIVLLLWGILIPALYFSQESTTTEKINWGAYTQLRINSDLQGSNNLMLRRLKLWAKSGSGFSKRWSYKLQATLTSLQKERFFLQDVKVSYHAGQFRFHIGQFVPAYSLQRFQSDYSLDFIERAKCINSLLPGSGMGYRDLGVQSVFTSKNKMIETSIGIFNGYGIFDYRLNNKGFMLTHKNLIQLSTEIGEVQLGYSTQYRKAENIELKYLLQDTILYSGNEYRYNIFAMYRSSKLHLQAEYLTAYLSNIYASGYYFSAAVTLSSQNQVAISYENSTHLIGTHLNSPFFHLAYNHFIKGRRLMLFFDNSFNIHDGKIEQYIASLQLQIFLK
jgi:hypothetical protein